MILIFLQSLYFIGFLCYINDIIYQLSVLLVVNWDEACALLFYNIYVGVYTLAILPIFMYELGKIYWFENEFEYAFNADNFTTGIYYLSIMSADID